jgi:two-component system response regulator YesN
MYKVILVDDERIIREGIASMIDWASLGLELAGTAADGQAAAELIDSLSPDIVITDVKMPVLDGLGLIALEHDRHPDVVFIVLSGYGEFDLASGAMRYGVKHYLLKPCNEHAIIDALREVTETLAMRERREDITRESRKYLEKMTPMLREQFLRHHMISNSYSAEEIDYYSDLLNMDKNTYRVVILQLDHEAKFEEIYALRRIAEDVFPPTAAYLSSATVDQLLILLQGADEDAIEEDISQIKTKYCGLYEGQFTASYSEEADIRLLPQAYREAERCLKYAFYLGEGSVISRKDVARAQGESFGETLTYDYDKIAVAIKSGNLEEVGSETDAFFEWLKKYACDKNVAKIYCMELFLTIARQSGTDGSSKANMDMLTKIQQTENIGAIHDIIRETSEKLTNANYENIRSKQSKTVSAMKKYVLENIDNEELSLKWMSTNVIFMNVGYLGRLFCKETGERFSHYILRVRMEKAKELIDSYDGEKIYEVAKKIGFGDNPQYFSKQFKKYTGCSPSEYKAMKSSGSRLA